MSGSQITSDDLRHLSAVWDNLNMAEFFIDKARADLKGPREIRLSWCLNIAAGGLWSAVDTFNKRVLGKQRKGEWINHNRRVSQIRHGGVHSDYAQGVGLRLAAGQGSQPVTPYVWVYQGFKRRQFTIGETLSLFDGERRRISEIVLERKGRVWTGR
jgi:hypothetical protein